MKYVFIVLLIAGLAGCNKYDANEGAGARNFTLSLLDTIGIRPDGASSITLRMSSTDDVKEGLRITFKSNKGALLQAEQPYAGRFAETKLLLVAEDTGVYSITATITEAGEIKAEKTVRASFRPAYIQEEFSLQAMDTAGVRLNGGSSITLAFKGPVPNKQNLLVHFDAPKGSLQQGDSWYSNGTAQAKLTVGQDTGLYIIKAQLKDGNNIKVEKQISFSLRRANPQSILLELDRLTWNPAQPVTVKTQLLRNDGRVTTGQQVFFTAYQLNGSIQVPVGRFTGIFNNTSNAFGLLTDVKLYTDTPGMDITKPVSMQVKTLNDQGDTLRQTVVLPYQ
jgi:hypothetical protein